jgi:hypothetical protein
MDNIKNDYYYLQKIKQDLEFIVSHMNIKVQTNIFHGMHCMV